MATFLIHNSGAQLSHRVEAAQFVIQNGYVDFWDGQGNLIASVVFIPGLLIRNEANIPPK